MTDLQSCYFCGTAENVQEYAVVPPRLGGDGHSAPLCEQCKGKLLRVIDPLIEQIEGEPATGADNAATEQSTSSREPNDNGITMNPGASSESGSSKAGVDAADHSAAGEDDASDDAPEIESATPNGPAGADSAETPPQYRRAMRMLANREFPIPRTEVESMLANAYDLEREEVDAVIDHAVEEGKLVEENGELREP